MSDVTTPTINADLAETITDALFAMGSGEGNIEEEKQKLLDKIQEYILAEWRTHVTGPAAEAERRFRAAEDVCVVYSWTGVRAGSPREKALSVLWNRWYDLVGYSRITSESNPHLDDDAIDTLADQYDDRRERNLEKLSKIVVVERGDAT